MSEEIPRKVLTELLIKVMQVQKAYAHEQVGARNDRRNEIKKLVNRVAAESLERR